MAIDKKVKSFMLTLKRSHKEDTICNPLSEKNIKITIFNYGKCQNNVVICDCAFYFTLVLIRTFTSGNAFDLCLYIT